MIFILRLPYGIMETRIFYINVAYLLRDIGESDGGFSLSVPSSLLS